MFFWYAVASFLAQLIVSAHVDHGSCLLQVRNGDIFRTTIGNQTRHSMQLGVISYWPPSSGYYDTLPRGSLAIINPMNGVFADQSMETLTPGIAEFQNVMSQTASRDIMMMGYVPTGYFDHSCNINAHCQTLERIQKQVEKYLELFPGLGGIFFDEVAPRNWDCGAFAPEYERLRQVVKSHSATAKIAWNAAVTSDCAVTAANSGEILVLFESGVELYGNDRHNMLIETARNARSKGVETWHLVHTVGTDQWQAVLAKARLYQPDWFFATNIGGNWQAGENTWGSPPIYWDQLKVAFGEVTATITPSEIPVGGSVSFTLHRPLTQCCVGYDWIGIYEKGSPNRLGFIHSSNNEDYALTLTIDSLIAGLGEGEYEFKYSTSVDGWVVHDLTPATLNIIPMSEPTRRPTHSPTVVPTETIVPDEVSATVNPSEITIGSSASLTLNRPLAQCCSEYDWVGIYKKGDGHRLGYVHSSNSEDYTLTLSLDSLIAGLGEGEYEFKYSSGIDGWVVHDLSPTRLKIIAQSESTRTPTQSPTLASTTSPTNSVTGSPTQSPTASHTRHRMPYSISSV